ncbi:MULTISPECIES: hypothetical protein [Yersinia]|nr:hypothetical protein [Yersinia sp. IP36721]
MPKIKAKKPFFIHFPRPQPAARTISLNTTTPDYPALAQMLDADA